MQNSADKEDLRVRRTRKMIQTALIELTVEKKGFNDVSVRDITERAMINRSTFYRHYLDKCDLVNQYMDDVYELLAHDEKIAVESDEVPKPSPMPSGLINLLKHVQEYAEFYRIMLGINGDPGFAEHFRQISEKRRRVAFGKLINGADSSELPIDMRMKYVSYAFIGVIVWWLENDQPCTVEQLARWISQISFPIWTGNIT